MKMYEHAQSYRRAGARPNEISRIKAMLADGKTVREVAQHFGIDEACIASFASSPKKSEADQELTPAVPKGAESFAGVVSRGKRK